MDLNDTYHIPILFLFLFHCLFLSYSYSILILSYSYPIPILHLFLSYSYTTPIPILYLCYPIPIPILFLSYSCREVNWRQNLMPKCIQNGREDLKGSQHEQTLLPNHNLEPLVFQFFTYVFCIKIVKTVTAHL